MHPTQIDSCHSGSLRTFSLGLLCLCLMSIPVLVLPAGAQSEQNNILIVVADDLGTDRLCRYRSDCVDGNLPPEGVALTPTLNTMIDLGVKFERAWANPVCSTTRSTIQTGQYSRRTGILAALGAGQEGLVDDDWTLAEMLAEAAACSADVPQPGCPVGLDVPEYETAAFGKWHLNGEAVQDPDGPGPLTGEAGPVAFGGFDYFEGTPANLGRNSTDNNIEDYCKFRWWTVRNDDGVISQDNGPPIERYATGHTVDRALEWLESRDDTEQPWLIYLAFHAPHTPLHRVLPSDEIDQLFTCGDPCTNPDDPINVTCFLEVVNAMDVELGRLLGELAALDQAGVTDFPTVLFLGDNGTESGVIDQAIYPSVDEKSHAKTSVHQGGVRVPFVASGAQVTNLGATMQPVTSADLFLTVAQLAGVEDPDLVRQLPSAVGRSIDSVSFAPRFAGANCSSGTTPCRDTLFAEIKGSGSQSCPDGICQVDRPASDALAIRIAEHPDFKLIRGCLPCESPGTPEEAAGCEEIDCADGECLYNLTLNPTEDIDLLRLGTPPPDSRPGQALAALQTRLDSVLRDDLGCTLDARGCPVSCE